MQGGTLRDPANTLGAGGIAPHFLKKRVWIVSVLARRHTLPKCRQKTCQSKKMPWHVLISRDANSHVARQLTPNIVPIRFFTSSHSQVGCNKFSSWMTPHTCRGLQFSFVLTTGALQQAFIHFLSIQEKSGYRFHDNRLISFGGTCGGRTCDSLLKRQILYLLS